MLSIKVCRRMRLPVLMFLLIFFSFPLLHTNVCDFHRMELRLTHVNFIFVTEKLPEIYCMVFLKMLNVLI